MPSRKQRRRRQKDRRHEYEYVYVDDEGHELEAPPEPERPGRRDRATKNGKEAKGGQKRGDRPAREYRPPSWNRALKRSLLFLPLFFIVFSLVNKHAAISSRVIASLGYSVLFIPLTYVMDRTAYRSYLRRSGQDPGGKRR
ncbi:MAG TPA: hypothetical protein VF002_03090 [Gaiellaceae bacterium]